MGMMCSSCGDNAPNLSDSFAPQAAKLDLELQESEISSEAKKIQEIYSSVIKNIDIDEKFHEISSFEGRGNTIEDWHLLFKHESLWVRMGLAKQSIESGILKAYENNTALPKEYFLKYKYRDDYSKWVDNLITQYIYPTIEEFKNSRRNPDQKWHERKKIFGNLEFHVATYGLVLIYMIEHSKELSDADKLSLILDVISTFKKVYCTAFERISGINLNTNDPWNPKQIPNYFDAIFTSNEQYCSSIYSFTRNKDTESEETVDFKIITGVPIYLIEHFALVGIRPEQPLEELTLGNICYFQDFASAKDLKSSEDFTNSQILCNFSRAVISYIERVIEEKIEKKSVVIYFEDGCVKKILASALPLTDFRFIEQNIDNIIIVDKILKLEQTIGMNVNTKKKEVQVSFILDNAYVSRVSLDKKKYKAIMPVNSIFKQGNTILKKYFNFDQEKFISNNICNFLATENTIFPCQVIK